MIFNRVPGNWTGFTTQWTITGNTLDNYIDARNVNTTITRNFLIDGGAGADVVVAVSSATNRIVVDNVNDTVFNVDSDDTIVSGITYTLPTGVRNLELSGSASVSAIGNSDDNVLNGSLNAAANSLQGGIGNDEYIVGANDTIVEAANAGTDTVRIGFVSAGGNQHTVANFANVENLIVDAAPGAATLVGDAVSNRLTGNAFRNVLDGRAGSDTLVGGQGDDRYIGFDLTSGDDVVIDSGGRDTLELAQTLDIAPSQINVSRSGDDLLIALSAEGSIRVQSWYSSATRLNAVEGLTLNHGGLQYTYGAAQLEARAAGVNGGPAVNAVVADRLAPLQQPFSFQAPLNTFSDLESQDSLFYSASLSDGSSLPSWLVFDATTRTFSGTPGASNAAALLVRLTATDAGGLTASSDFVLDVGGVVRTGTAGDDSLVGDGRDELLRGLGRSDRLNGAGGADELWGDRGEDTYVLDATSGNDVIREVDGLDRIEFASSSGITLTNLAASRVGNDLRIGYGSNSVVVADHYASNAKRVDEIVVYQSGVPYIYSAAQIEGLVVGANTNPYAGVPLADRALKANTTWTYQVPANTFSDTQSQTSLTYSARLVGGAALPSWLTFTASTRTLSGKAPNGTNADFAIEIVATDPLGLAATDAFTLRVRSSLTTWTGTANGDSPTGGTGNDYQLGMAGNDTLRGGAGDDIQEGGDGNDSLLGEDGSDAMYGGAGDDVLNGGAGVNTLFGDDGHDQLTGGASGDTLSGGKGDDVLTGGLNSDNLSGGDGSDTYVYAKQDGADTVDNSSVDTEADKLLISGYTRGELAFTRSGNDLRIAGSYYGDQVTVKNWFTNTNNRIDSIETSEGIATTADEIDALVSSGGTQFQGGASTGSMLMSNYDSAAFTTAGSTDDVTSGVTTLATADLEAGEDAATTTRVPRLTERFAPTAITGTGPANPSSPSAPSESTGAAQVVPSADLVEPAHALTFGSASKLNWLMEAAGEFHFSARDRNFPRISPLRVQHDIASGTVSSVSSHEFHDSATTDRQLAQLVAAAAGFADFGDGSFDSANRHFERAELRDHSLVGYSRRHAE